MRIQPPAYDTMNKPTALLLTLAALVAAGTLPAADPTLGADRTPSDPGPSAGREPKG
jgi:hypothetical protein